MTLFSSGPRSEQRARFVGESIGAFLERRAGPSWDRVRALLEQWLERTPPAARTDLAKRLRSERTDMSAVAFWELYVHELLRNSGCGVDIHPALEQTSNRCDFEVDGGRFFVEVVSVFPSEAERGMERRIRTLIDALRPPPNLPWRLFVSIEVAGPRSLRASRLLGEIRSWLLAPSHRGEEDEDDRLRLPIAVDGWELVIHAAPRDPSEPPASRVGFATPAVDCLDEARLRDRLLRKIGRYGSMRAPFVIAIHNAESMAGPDVIATVLYGGNEDGLLHMSVPAGVMGLHVPKPVPPVWGGACSARRDVPAVLYANSLLLPWTAAREQPLLLLSPEPNGFDPRLPVRYAHGLDAAVADTSSRVPNPFGLPRTWPEGA